MIKYVGFLCDATLFFFWTRDAAILVAFFCTGNFGYEGTPSLARGRPIIALSLELNKMAARAHGKNKN